VGEFKRSRLFTPWPLEFRESAYKRGEATFMVLTVEPRHVPSLKVCFHRKDKEADTRAGLETHPSDNLAISGARLVFQEEVIFEQGKVRGNAKKCFAKMDKDSDFKNRVRVEMDWFNLVVIEESVEKVRGWEAESTLEERGKHHNLICIGCRNIFIDGRTPLQHSAVWEKVVRDDLTNLIFIRGGRLKQV
jgi:hypothetical protein